MAACNEQGSWQPIDSRLMQDDWNSDDWPISTPIPPLTLMLGGIAGQPNNGTYIKGSMWDKTPCRGLGQAWLECVLN